MNSTKILTQKLVVGFIVLAVFILFSSSVYAQNYSLKDRCNFKFGYSDYPPLGIMPNANRWASPTFLTEFNRGVNHFIEIGAYTGGSTITVVNKFSSNGYIIHIPTIFYGINSNVHLIPFLIHNEKFRIDVYASGKLGGFYRLTPEGYLPGKGHVWDFGIYLGAAYYFGKHMGFFGELGKGNYTNHRYGLSIKF